MGISSRSFGLVPQPVWESTLLDDDCLPPSSFQIFQHSYNVVNSNPSCWATLFRVTILQAQLPFQTEEEQNFHSPFHSLNRHTLPLYSAEVTKAVSHQILSPQT